MEDGLAGPDDEGRFPDTAPEWTIGAVSHALDVPVATLTLWERRHQIPTGRTEQAGQRRHTEADVAALTQIRDETAAGRKSAETTALATASPTATPGQTVASLLAATHRLDTPSITEALQHARRTHGLTVTLEQVLLLALREIGQQWADGRADPAHEHLLASAAQTWLSTEHRHTHPPQHHRGTVVLACGPEDQHTLAVEAFALLLADRGLDYRYLGAQTPISSLVLTAQQPSTCAIVLVCHLDHARTAATTALQTLATLPVTTYYAGAAFDLPEQRQTLPGTYLGDSLSAAADLITTTTGTR